MSKYLLFVDDVKVTEDRGINLVAGDNITLTPTETITGLPQVEITGSAGGADIDFTFGGNVTG